MKPYSASEALWPAAERACDYLFRSFKTETFLKLAAMATLCEGFLVSFRFTAPNTLPDTLDAARVRAFLLAPAFLPVTILATAALFLALVYGFYLVTRLRFAFFHSLVHHTRQIRPAWKLYPVEAERLFTASVLIWLGFLVAAVLGFVAIFVAAYGVVATPTPEGKLDPGHFLILFFPCLFMALALVVAAFLAQVVLNDFILPHMALENVSFRAAWAAVKTRMRAHRETFTSYFILRLGLPLVAGVLLALAAWLVGAVVFGVLGASAAGFDVMLDGGGALREGLRLLVAWLFVFLDLAAGLGLAVTLAGPLGVFMRTYALLFYGGHYQALGNLLEPPRV